MDPLQQSMNEVEEKMVQFKSDRDDLQLKIVLGRSKSTVSRKRERMIIDRYVQAERAKQEKQIQTEYNKWSLKLEHQMVNLAKKNQQKKHVMPFSNAMYSRNAPSQTRVIPSSLNRITPTSRMMNEQWTRPLACIKHTSMLWPWST